MGIWLYSDEAAAEDAASEPDLKTFEYTRQAGNALAALYSDVEEPETIEAVEDCLV